MCKATHNQPIVQTVASASSKWMPGVEETDDRVFGRIKCADVKQLSLPKAQPPDHASVGA